MWNRADLHFFWVTAPGQANRACCISTALPNQNQNLEGGWSPRQKDACNTTSPWAFPWPVFPYFSFPRLMILAVFPIIKSKSHINILCVLYIDCLMKRYSYFKGMKTDMNFCSLDGLTQVFHIEPALHFMSQFLRGGVCFTYLASGSSVGRYSVDYFPAIAVGCFACCLMKYIIERQEYKVLTFLIWMFF